MQPGWVATLTRAGRRAIALDNRGHGQSDAPFTNYTMDELVEDIETVRQPCGFRSALFWPGTLSAARSASNTPPPTPSTWRSWS